MLDNRSCRRALAFSAAFHAAVVAAAVWLVAPAHRVEDEVTLDAWTGDTFELAALLEAPLATPAGQGESGSPGPIAEAKHAAPELPAAKAVPDEAGTHAVAPKTVKKTRPSRRTPKSPSVSVAVGPASSSAPGAAGSGRAQSSAAFGASGQRGVRNLAKAFTRAVPMAASDAKLWERLPLGPAGQLELTIRVNDAGNIVSASPQGIAVPSHLQALVQRTIAMLRAGRFALGDGTVVVEGVETLLISVALSQAEGPAGGSAGGAFALGFEPPSLNRAGRAYLTLSSGRHVEVTVKRVASPG